MKDRYKIIRTEKQYFDYCDTLEQLIEKGKKKYIDDIELLTLLIEKWDKDNLASLDVHPITLIKDLMTQNNIKSNELAVILKVNKSTVSRILNLHKGLSKKSIRVLSEYFAIDQNALNQPYKLKNILNENFKNEALMNTKKKMEKT